MTVLLRRLWIQITSDRKRLGVLVALLALGMLLWARIIITANLPREAVAGEEGRGPTAAPPRPASAAEESAQPPPVRVRLAEQWHRDPLVAGGEELSRSTPPGGSRADPSKSGLQTVEDSLQEEVRLTARLEALVNRFRLEAIMQGHPMAVINGQSFQPGDVVPAIGDDERFLLVEVSDRATVLECRGRRFRLTMKDPRSQRR
jgi:hypothetical protein